MSTKTSGLEFKAFYNDSKVWKNGRWHEDEIVFINHHLVDEFDIAKINDSDMVLIEGGVIYEEDGATEVGGFEGQFRKWKRNQDTTTLLVRAPNAKTEAIRAAIKAAGGTLL